MASEKSNFALKLISRRTSLFSVTSFLFVKVPWAAGIILPFFVNNVSTTNIIIKKTHDQEFKISMQVAKEKKKQEHNIYKS